jgi:N-acyl-D-aspartate/D-glutamate deacylase
MTDVARSAIEAEIQRMSRDVEEAMEAGAFGLSTGLYYPHSSASEPAEVAHLLSIVGRHRGLYTTHMRDEGDALLESIDEACGAADKSGVRLVISHLKCASPRAWGTARRALDRIEEWSRRIEVAFDAYPYEASSTMIRPDRIGDARSIKISWSEPHPEMSGRDLGEVASCWCCAPEQAARRLMPGGAIYFKMIEEDVETILAHPRAMIGSDGLPFDPRPHPRLWGTFPRVLGHYVRARRLIELEEAIRRMTGWTAAVFGLADRGTIKAGANADIVIFDADEIADQATYEEGALAPHGIEHVLVNGRHAMCRGEMLAPGAGALLKPSTTVSTPLLAAPRSASR